jgi:hypothetical protein
MGIRERTVGGAEEGVGPELEVNDAGDEAGSGGKTYSLLDQPLASRCKKYPPWLIISRYKFSPTNEAYLPVSSPSLRGR